MPGCDGQQAREVAERGRQAIAAEPLDPTIRLSASAGVCEVRSEVGRARSLDLADGALYWANAHGRSTTVVYGPARVSELSHAERAGRLSRSQTLASLRSLARAVDAKDHVTKMHFERVADLAVRLATTLSWDQIGLVQLREAGLLHDVGKIGVPDSVLLKPGRLTDDEFRQIRQHAALGAEIVTGVLSPEQVAWVRGHHKRWDGGGYPDRLGGDAITEGASHPGGRRQLGRHDREPAIPIGAVVAGGVRRVAGGRRSQWSPAIVGALTLLWEAGALAPVPRRDDTPLDEVSTSGALVSTNWSI